MKSNIFKILKKELRETIRDKKSLMMMLLMPFIIPAFAIGMSFFYEAMSDTPIENYNKLGFAYEVTDAEKLIFEELQIEPVYDNVDSLKEQYEKGEINLYITREDKTYTLHGDYDESTQMADALAMSYLEAYKVYLQSEYLVEQEINPLEVIDILRVQEDITMKKNPFVEMITQECFMFLIMALAMAAVYTTTDSIAGEKEKGTLETLLTFPVKSKDIILGKFLSISISSIVAGLLSIVLMLGSLFYLDGAFTIYEDANIIPSFQTICYMIFMVVIYSFFISGLCIAVASKTKTYKEAQSALTPVSFIAFIPSLIATLMGLKTTTVFSLIPFLNISLLFNDMIAGNINLINLALGTFSSLIFIVIVLSIIIKQYKSEKVLFSN